MVRELRRSLIPCAEQSIPTPAISDLSQSPPPLPALTAFAGEQFISDYSVHELPDVDDNVSEFFLSDTSTIISLSDTSTINSALLAQVEFPQDSSYSKMLGALYPCTVTTISEQLLCVYHMVLK